LKVILLILILVSFGLGQYPHFPGWLGFSNFEDLEGLIPTDTTPPDTFETTPVVTFLPDSFHAGISIQWLPSEIDSSDWNTISFNLRIWDRDDVYPINTYRQPEMIRGADPLILTATKAKADSDTVLTWRYYYHAGSFFSADTSDSIGVTITLTDTSNNSVSMAEIWTRIYVNYENELSVDSTWIDADSIYIRTNPSDYVKTNTVFSDAEFEFRFLPYRYPIAEDDTLIGTEDWDADFMKTGVKKKTLAQLFTDSLVGIDITNRSIVNIGDSIFVNAMSGFRKITGGNWDSRMYTISDTVVYSIIAENGDSFPLVFPITF